MADIDTQKLKELMMAMINVIDQSEQKTESDTITHPITNKDAKQTSTRPNLFDSMPEAQMHRSDSAIDKKLSSYPPTARSRPSTIIDVQCCICGKKETVSKRLLVDSANRYKCNNCCSKGSS